MNLRALFLSATLLSATVIPQVTSSAIAQTTSQSVAGQYTLENHQGFMRVGPMSMPVPAAEPTPVRIVNQGANRITLKTGATSSIPLKQLPGGLNDVNWTPTPEIKISPNDLAVVAGKELKDMTVWHGKTPSWFGSGFPGTLTLVQVEQDLFVGFIVGQAPDTIIVRQISLRR